jgi:hypothetical protein
MNPIIKKDILNVLREALRILKNDDIFKLRELSDHVIHNATVFQDKDSITVAVSIYAMSKAFKDKNAVDPRLLVHLSKAIRSLEKAETISFEKAMKSIVQIIAKQDGSTKFYVEEVLERAQVKKASKIYEHGISLGQAADKIGISLWDLMEYVGRTNIADKFEDRSNLKSRLEFTRGLFR